MPWTSSGHPRQIKIFLCSPHWTWAFFMVFILIPPLFSSIYITTNNSMYCFVSNQNCYLSVTLIGGITFIRFSILQTNVVMNIFQKTFFNFSDTGTYKIESILKTSKVYLFESGDSFRRSLLEIILYVVLRWSLWKSYWKVIQLKFIWNKKLW